MAPSSASYGLGPYPDLNTAAGVRTSLGLISLKTVAGVTKLPQAPRADLAGMAFA
jgi:hypothetical protein